MQRFFTAHTLAARCRLAFVLVGLLTLLQPLFAQVQPVEEADLPREVMVAFRKNFPVIAVDALLTAEGNYQLTFRADGADRVYLYAGTGRLLVMRMVAEGAQVPEAVMAAGREMEGAETIHYFRSRNAKDNCWEIHQKGKEGEWVLRLTAEGKKLARARVQEGCFPAF